MHLVRGMLIYKSLWQPPTSVTKVSVFPVVHFLILLSHLSHGIWIVQISLHSRDKKMSNIVVLFWLCVVQKCQFEQGAFHCASLFIEGKLLGNFLQPFTFLHPCLLFSVLSVHLRRFFLWQTRGRWPDRQQGTERGLCGPCFTHPQGAPQKYSVSAQVPSNQELGFRGVCVFFKAFGTRVLWVLLHCIREHCPFYTWAYTHIHTKSMLGKRATDGWVSKTSIFRAGICFLY